MRTRRWLGMLAAGLFLAAACGGDGDGGGSGAAEGSAGDVSSLGDNILIGPQEREGEPVSGGTIEVGLESETNSYLPSAFQGSQAGYNVAYAIYDPLVTRDANGDIQPYLAESIQPNEDFTEWTLKLRPDVKFHDGTPLNAEALKRNMDDYLKAPTANTAGSLRDVSMEVVDELTVKYVLENPNAVFPDSLAGVIGWPFSPDAADRLGDDFGSQPVGTGPFKFVSWERDGAFVVERNEDYWQEGLPYLDGITFRPIPDEETRATSLESDDIQATQSVRLSSFLTRVKDIPGVTVYLGLGNGAGNIMFNTEAPPVDDVRVRQALAHALDQEALVELVAGEAAVATELRSQFFWSESPYFSEAVHEAWPEYDPDEAQSLLEEYVNDPQRSDGKAPGEPVSLTYDCTNVPSLIEQATAVQGMWEEIGVEVDVEPMEQSAHISGALTGDYQVKCFRAGVDQDPLTTFQTALGDPERVITNFTNYSNPAVDEAIAALRTTPDVELRATAVEALGLQLVEDMPIYWTGSDLTFIAAREGVNGIASWLLPDGSPGDGAAPAITFWSQVWLSDE
ncbi:MAG TPA: ABC transporter substrate-binding protein [Acidimicrobiales bacterium]